MTDDLASSLAAALGVPMVEIEPFVPPSAPPVVVLRSLTLPEASEDGVGELSAARRERELRDVSSPSALIRRAQKEWPHACTRVAALAASEGIALGEAWLRVILAGVATLEAGNV